MSTELEQKICSKCLKIYARNKSLRPMYKFLDRLVLDNEMREHLTEEVILPEIRRQYFPDFDIEVLLQEFLAVYRGSASHISALIDVWNRLDTQLPFINDEYTELVERFCALLENEPNPPSKADWEALDEWLMK